ncbi:ABC transporter ATP-binding protein [Bacillus sp. FJAT-22090]|uniref:ABC transporter ATP-binding protein n=1 Tax=Bacillus sp. FJAT-22090 TaxID=1581038 RepID=UPI0011A4EEF7|nr:ABC transporter ATP-binding protein [Bacillus sp. FJAT-22090]
MVNSDVNFKEVIASFKNWPRVFKLLWKTEKKSLIIILMLSVLGGLSPSLILIGNQFLINSVSIGWEKGFHLVIKGLVLLASIYILQLIILQINEYVKGVFALKLANHVNIIIMEKSLKLTLKDFEDASIYDQLQRAQMEASSRPFAIFNQILFILSSFVTLVSTAMILILWKWWLVLLLLIIPLLSSLSLLRLGKKEFNVEWERAPTRRKSWYMSFLLTKDVNIKEIKLFNLGEHLLKQYKKINTDFVNVDKKLLFRRTILTSAINILNQIVVTLLTLYILIAALSNQIMIGTMVSYIQALSSTQSTTGTLLNQIFSMYENNLYMEQLFSFLDIEEEAHDQDDNISKIELNNINSIEFKNVSFKYPYQEKYSLENVSFLIKKDEVIAIVGKNGSGKTTLVKLLTKLYMDYSGEILINDIPINQYSTKSLQDNIGVLFQDFIKYELTARENIGFGKLESLQNNERLFEAIRKSGIYDKVNDLPQKLDTQLGRWFAEGQQLSGGEWQKIGISRAIVRDASLYILDEPSSALDPNAEKYLFESFHKLISGKIGIYISHRFSTVKNATRILVFDEGKIIENDTHTNLMKQNGVYAELYNLQASPYLYENSFHLIEG